jgi:hypothetical protein
MIHYLAATWSGHVEEPGRLDPPGWCRRSKQLRDRWIRDLFDLYKRCPRCGRPLAPAPPPAKAKTKKAAQRWPPERKN